VYGFDVSFIESLNDLASPFNLERYQSDLEKQKDSVIEKYKAEMKEAVELHRKDVFEKDKQTRAVLKVISDIGFDVIPKQFTDQLIDEVKSGSLVINGISLDPARLDLKNGNF